MTISTDKSSTRPSAWYLFSLAMGCVGLTFMAVGLGGALIGRGGGNPDDAVNVDGFVMFIFSFVIVFSMRLIFWPPVPPSVRTLVRAAITVIIALGVPLALLGLILAWQLPPATHHTDLPIGSSILAVLCQPLALLWLTRYRQEGL